MTTIAIMQPTYLPWIGYFGMIDRADRFVFLDSVQFARRSWQQRNRIKTANGVQMLTVPVLKKGARDQSIAEVQIDTAARFAEKHRRAIEHALGKSPYFKDYAGPLFAILEGGHAKLADLNIALIGWLCEAFGIDGDFARSSEIAAEGSKAELLAALCTALGGEVYLSAPGSADYIEESDAFERAGVTVAYHRYDHPAYPQLHGPFEPYMSAVDLLFNCGPGSLERIRAGYVEDAAA
ncbi:MAG: WbqC family protein [Kiloniellaceae bacterium]